MYFQEFGISADYALKLYKIYGADAVELVKENPYRLTSEVYGIGFRKADTIAHKMGFAEDSPFRIKSGIKYGLTFYASEGSTYVPQQELCEKVGNLLELSSELVYENLVEMAFEGEVNVDTIEGRPVVYLYAYYYAEKKICRNLAAIENASLKSLTVDVDSMIQMTERQSGMVSFTAAREW